MIIKLNKHQKAVVIESIMMLTKTNFRVSGNYGTISIEDTDKHIGYELSLFKNIKRLRFRCVYITVCDFNNDSNYNFYTNKKYVYNFVLDIVKNNITTFISNLKQQQ